jgi:WD40 repeat protein
MSYCLNPDCQKPQNPNGTKFCQTCGTKLLLAERYRAIKPLAQGGFGRTLLAEDEYKPSKPQCVIKQFYPQGQNKAGKAAELFQQEAVRLEQLGKHPQIPELFAHFEQDNRQYIVQEFIDGQNLAEELAETRVFREKQIRSLLADLLPVLQFIHQGQVIHRDIKPENIIRRRSDGKLVLVDFGAAKYATGTALGKTGTTIGSAGYAAPEQTFGQAVFASDIYSLGVTCIHLLTDIEPFELYNAMESAFVWRHYLGNNPVSDQLGRILDKMTQSVVKHRYKTAEAVMQALGLKVGTQTSKNKPLPQINRKVIQPPTPSVGRQSGTSAPVPKPTSPAKAASSPSVQIVNSKIGYESIALVATISISEGLMKSVAISPDGQKVATSSGDFASFSSFAGKNNTVRIWDIDSRKVIHSLTGHSAWVNSIAFSPDGQTLASGSDDGIIKLWDVRTGQEKRTLKGHSVSVHSIAFSPDGQTLACGSFKMIQLWKVSTAGWKPNLYGHSGAVDSVVFSPDGQTLASASSVDGTIKLWNISTGQEQLTLKHPDWVYFVAFSPDGQTFASGGGYKERAIKLWDVHTWREKSTLQGHSDKIRSIAFSPDGQTIASGSQDKTIKLWDVHTGQEKLTLKGHLDAVYSVAFSPDGLTLFSSGYFKDEAIKIWRVIR